MTEGACYSSSVDRELPWENDNTVELDSEVPPPPLPPGGGNFRPPAAAGVSPPPPPPPPPTPCRRPAG